MGIKECKNNIARVKYKPHSSQQMRPFSHWFSSPAVLQDVHLEPGLVLMLKVFMEGLRPTPIPPGVITHSPLGLGLFGHPVTRHMDGKPGLGAKALCVASHFFHPGTSGVLSVKVKR